MLCYSFSCFTPTIPRAFYFRPYNWHTLLFQNFKTLPDNKLRYLSFLKVFDIEHFIVR